MRFRPFCLSLLLLFAAQAAYAGAWTQPKGDGLFIAQATYFTSDAFFDENAIKVAQPRFSKYELQPYAEYGLRDWLTIGGSAYLQSIHQAGNSNIGIGDPELFARLRLWQGMKDVFAIQPLVKLPSLYAHSGTPRGGSRSTDAELSLLYGRNMHILSERDYVDLRVGYRVRGKGLNPQWRVDAALGIHLSESWQVIPAFRGVTAVDYNEYAVFSENAEQDYDLAKAEVTIAYSLDENRWLQATAFDHVAGALTGAGRGFSVGFAQRF